MYCSNCNWEGDGNYCPWCGSKAVSSSAKSNIQQEQTMEQSQSEDWYYAFQGESKGPISEAELLQMLQTGYINENTNVWKQGFANWMPIKQAGIDMGQVNKVDKKVNNIPILLLICIPIISIFVQYLFAGITQTYVEKWMFVAFIMNVGCCAIDCHKLKKAGYNVDKLMIAFIIFIPLYIYKRMSIVKGKKWIYTMAWIAVLAIDICIPEEIWVKAVNMSNPSVIMDVKDGCFDSYKDITVGQLFDKTLDSCTWKTYMGQKREILVEAIGILTIDEKNYNLDTIFELNKDSSFEVVTMKEDGIAYKDNEILAMLTYLYSVKDQ